MSTLLTALRRSLVVSAGMLLLVGVLAGSTAWADDLSDDLTEDTTQIETDYGRLLLVLDSSGSMAEPASGGVTKIEAAKQALGQVVDGLPEQAFVGLRVYGATVFNRSQGRACQDSQLVVEPGTDNRDDLQSEIDSYEPFGETPIAYSLLQAAKDIGNEGTRSIVLVSDGEETCDADPCEVAAQIAAKGIDLQIDVVGLGVSGAARQQLQCIADRGNGTYYDADSAEEISESLTEATRRAVRPFELEGSPIEGGASPEQATEVEMGQYVDTLGAATSGTPDRWFRYTRTQENSTVHASASSLGGGGFTDSLQVAMTDLEGQSCGIDVGSQGVNKSTLLGASAWAGRRPDELDSNVPCRAEEVLIVVRRSVNTSQGESDYSLRILEERDVPDSSALPAAINTFDAPTYQAPASSGPSTSVEGGSSFGDATELESGVYTGTVVAGETQVFKLPVEWGQTLSARVTTPPMSDALLNEFGPQGPFGNLAIHNPMRGQITSVVEGTGPSGLAANSRGDELTMTTPPVRYANRFATGSTNAYLAGDHYLVYAVEDEDNGSELPFTLEVEVQGEPEGAPTYASEATIDSGAPETPIETPSEDPAEAPDLTRSEEPEPSPASEASEGISTPIKLVSAGGLGLVAIGCLVAALMLVRRPTRR